MILSLIQGIKLVLLLSQHCQIEVSCRALKIIVRDLNTTIKVAVLHHLVNNKLKHLIQVD